MTENLEWERKELDNKFIRELETLVNGVVFNELNDINSKIESLCSMGVITDDEKIKELREKMKQLGNK